jgi:cytochrome bd ubiquinol oxidase subunit I
MDPVLLSRIQFAFTIGFHFLFAPLSIGLAWLIVWIMAKHRRSGDERYHQLARFWVRVFALTFAIGVATGLTMEFQFGTNWAAYSRFVGDIFGAPLAAEVIFTFFLESTFLYVLVFGWDRVSPTVHWVSSLLVAVGSTMSAFWILAANSWMQTPAGYVLRNGRAELLDFWQAVFNPSMVPRFLHTVDGALVAGVFFMLGVSAWLLLRQQAVETSRYAVRLCLLLGFALSVLQLGFGHLHAVQVSRTQPEKLAAFEALFDTQKQAPLLIFGLPDPENATVKYAIRVPGGLSLLVHFRLNGTVQGLNDFPRDEWPPIYLTFFPFHLMFLIGMYLIAMPALGLLLWWLRQLFDGRFSRYYLWLAVLSTPFPIICNELGWMTAEVGRQPWIVYRVMKTADAISISVPASHILASILIFGAIYGLLFLVWALLMARHIRRGPGEAAPAAAGEGPA